MKIEERVFNFSRQTITIEYGFVTAKTKEQALELIKKDEYDDIMGICTMEVLNDTIKIEGDENKNEN